MLSRRRLLRRSLYSALGLSLNKGVPALGHRMASPPQVRSGVKLTRYVDPLVIPPVIHATGKPYEVIDIEMRQFQQKVHRDLPPTTLWGYNGSWPGPTIEVQSGQALNINWTIPPSHVKSIGDSLVAKNIPFKYYGEGWNLYVTDPTESNTFDRYCNICNPFQYQTQFMGTLATREKYIADTTQLYEDIDTNNLPPVSIVKPSGFNDGHPASSKLDLFEGFVKKIVNQVKANPSLWDDTAIFVTFDEGGGYYDSGYIQPVDFFGDGTRIPLIVVSKYSKGGHVSHEYGDHVSLIKFIEKNWGLSPITARSRDNLPNPIQKDSNPYVPTNSPALGDLSDSFQFPAN